MIFSKTEALDILKASDEAAISEQYEQLLFDWKQKYLRDIPPIAVMKAQQTKITRLNEAMETFGVHFDLRPFTRVSLDQTLSASDYLKAYQQVLMPVKLNIANVSNGVELIHLLDHLISMEEGLLKRFSIYGNDLNYLDWSRVKISQGNMLFEIQQELIEKGLLESELLNYLRNEIKNNAFPFQSNLLNLVLKGTKYFQ
ncbi:hypothetical protein DNU06_11130 [Putridiphycobacter roseus]|uniref:Uncharacterized protein n=1 Tax=Putridiphycobacter roseus TaxID=2219161 RepID=A0A2W1NMD2_9FLAO|nr:hypothetical protein [Putridiphycobacter roseus]PZE16802.1 hypothetical protein DNU06_11130 [Putridiphycobacter roseus]